MVAISDKDYVLSLYPKAVCHGPIKIVNPPATVYVISGDASHHLGEGSTEAAAWKKVAERLKS